MNMITSPQINGYPAIPAFGFDPALARALTPEKHSVRRLGFIMRQGLQNNGIHIIHSGWAIKYRRLSDGRRQIFNVLIPGDAVGIKTLITGAQSCAVQALSDVEHYSFRSEDLLSRSQEDPKLRNALLAHLIRGYELAESNAIALGRLSAEERIAEFFLTLHERLEARGLVDGLTFRMELTQSHLADVVGLTLVHTNRVLQRLRARGVMSFVDQSVHIEDIDALRQMSPTHEGYADLPLLQPLISSGQGNVLIPLNE